MKTWFFKSCDFKFILYRYVGVFAPEAAAPYLRRPCEELTVSWAGDARDSEAPFYALVACRGAGGRGGLLLEFLQVGGFAFFFCDVPRIVSNVHPPHSLTVYDKPLRILSPRCINHSS